MGTFKLVLIFVLLSVGSCNTNSGTDEVSNLTSSLCEPGQKAYKIMGSIALPKVQNIPGVNRMDSLIDLKTADSTELRHKRDTILIRYLQQKMDTFSWNSFIALNWKSLRDGNPDTTACFGNSDGIPVWEHWMPSDEVFKEDGSMPTLWNSGLTVDGWPVNTGYNSKLLLTGKGRRHTKLDASVIKEVDNHPLVDQNGNHTFYEVFLNKTAYDYIVDGGLYNQSGQRKFTLNWPNLTKGLSIINEKGDTFNVAEYYKRAYFSIGNQKDSTEIHPFHQDRVRFEFTTNDGSIMVKTAWRELTDKENSSRYHTRRIRDENGEIKKLGLVGMHIAHKVAEATQWIWSTFEHVDNAPEIGDDGVPILAPGVDYSYFDESNMDSTRFNKPPASDLDMTPTQVVRVNKLYESVNGVNEYYHSIFRAGNENSVWLNYKLVGTQWPFDTELFTFGGRYQPTLLSNTVMETFLQEKSSCMTCHTQASFLHDKVRPGFFSDFVFQLSRAK